MKLSKPQVQLIKKPLPDGQLSYILHVVTIFDNTIYKADGHEPIPVSAEEAVNGIFTIRLKVKKEGVSTILLTPVVHTIDLGIFPFTPNAQLIEVKVVDEDNREALSRKQHQDDADDDVKPGPPSF